MQKMLCDNFYKACCDQWGVSRERRCMENALLMSTDVGTHSESAELTVRRLRSLPAAPRTCARRGSHSFVFWPGESRAVPLGRAKMSLSAVFRHQGKNSLKHKISM
jgi:hypothetical protein